jgi:hypothetical protein
LNGDRQERSYEEEKGGFDMNQSFLHGK